MPKSINVPVELAQLCLNVMARIRLADLNIADNLNATAAIQSLDKILAEAFKKEEEQKAQAPK